MDTLGYREWTDGFAFDNVPETTMDGSYHLTTGTLGGNSQNQTVLDISYPITVRLFLKGFRDPAQAIDESISAGESIVCDLVSVANANGTAIKDVQFVSMEPQPKDESNDNIVVLVISFTARVFTNPN